MRAISGHRATEAGVVSEPPKRYVPYKRFRGAVIPNWLMKRPELSQGAKICWARLAQYARQNGNCYPKQSTLATELGVTKRQTQDYIGELENAQLIEIERRGKLNSYFFLEHEWSHANNSSTEGEPGQANQSSTEQANNCSSDKANSCSTQKRVSRKESSELTDDRAIFANGTDVLFIPKKRNFPKTFEEVADHFEELCGDREHGEHLARRFITWNDNRGWRLFGPWKTAADGFFETVQKSADGV